MPILSFTGDVRNDVYVTLIQGEFDRGNRPKPKNVEVGISVCDEDCNVLKVGHMSLNTTEQDENYNRIKKVGSCMTCN